MTFLLIAGYIPATILMLAAGMVWSSRRNDSRSARALGDRVGRRNGSDRRADAPMPFVGQDRRSGAERRGAVAKRSDRAA
jgi:hypothetical protein